MDAQTLIARQTGFEEKMRAYLTAHAAQQHETDFGWNTFRVLTVTTDHHRIQSMMEALRKLRIPHSPGVDKAENSVITLAAKSYVSSDATCTVDWVSETAGARGTIYSAHLQCLGTAERAGRTVSNVVLRPTDANQLRSAPIFGSLKTYQRCPGMAPGPPR